MSKIGISPIISFVMILAVAFTAVSILSTFGFSQVEQLRDTASIESMTSNLNQVGAEILNTAALAENTQTTVRMQIDRGSLRYNNESLIYEIRTQSSIISSGTRRKAGNVFISADAQASLEKTTVSGTTCYRLENDHVSACINAYGGDPDTFTSGSLTNLTLSLDNNYAGRTYDPTTRIRLNDDTAYNSGDITVDPGPTGNYLGEAAVTVYVNPSNRPAYELAISLSTGSDYLQFDIQ